MPPKDQRKELKQIRSEQWHLKLALSNHSWLWHSDQLKMKLEDMHPTENINRILHTISLALLNPCRSQCLWDNYCWINMWKSSSTMGCRRILHESKSYCWEAWLGLSIKWISLDILSACQFWSYCRTCHCNRLSWEDYCVVSSTHCVSHRSRCQVDIITAIFL